MSTALLQSFPKPTPRGIRYEEYRRLVDEGFFETERVELIEGEILPMSPVSELHNITVLIAQRALQRAFGDDFAIRPQMSLGFPALNSSPEPDLAITRFDPRLIFQPPSNPLLVVEVSLSTLPYDLGAKAALYALANIPEYWVLDLPARTLHLHLSPREGRYTSIIPLPESAPLKPLHASQSLQVKDLLP